MAKDVFSLNVAMLADSYQCLTKKKKTVISTAVARRLAKYGLSLQHLKLAYTRDKEAGVPTVLSEHGFQKKSHYIPHVLLWRI